MKHVGDSRINCPSLVGAILRWGGRVGAAHVEKLTDYQHMSKKKDKAPGHWPKLKDSFRSLEYNI